MRRKRIETIRNADGSWRVVEYYEDLGPSRAAGVNRMTGGAKGHRNRGQLRTVTPAGLTPKKGTTPSHNKEHPSEKHPDHWLTAVSIRKAKKKKLKGNK